MALTPEQWENVKELFAAALETRAAERASFLLHACSEPAIWHEVERLLANHTAGSAYLEPPSRPSDKYPAHQLQFLSPGDLLAERLRISRFLASGGMGEVYEAEDIELHERIALKMIRPELLSDGQTLDRFKRGGAPGEACYTSQRLPHFDLFRHRDTGPGEVASGVSSLSPWSCLKARPGLYLRQKQRMTVEEALPIAVQVGPDWLPPTKPASCIVTSNQATSFWFPARNKLAR